MTATQFVFPHPYYDMVCNRLADFDNFCKAKCAEREAGRASKPYSLWERVLNLGVDCRIGARGSQQPYNWLDGKDYYSQYIMPYREQYKRLNELYVWLTHCVQEDIRVQISHCFIIWRIGMNFELWVWGDGVDIGSSNYKVINTWQDEPTHKTVRAECEFYLGCLGFEACKPVFPPSSYDVLKDGEWNRVYFMLREN